MSALLKSEPCDYCEHRRTIGRVTPVSIDPPDVVCACSPSGDFDCDRMREAGKLGDIAASFAHQLTEVDDLDVRRELAEAVCDAFSNALNDLGGSDIDAIEFLRRAGLAGEQVAA